MSNRHSRADRISSLVIAGLALLAAPSARADGAPHPWGMGLQTPGSSIGSRINDFHAVLLVIISVVVLLVLALLVYVIVRYRKSRNPEPSRTTHNVRLEIAWTAIPCLIVLGIASISFPLLYDIDHMPDPDLTLKVTSHQWYWSYEYPDHGAISFDSMSIWSMAEPTEEQVVQAVAEASARWLVKGPPLRQLEVDNRVVLPVGKVVRVQITGADVLHSWFVPSLGINRMAVAGRLNEVWFKIDQPGLYYGQCSMVCGIGHAYMPIVIEAVAADQFEGWAATQKAATDGARSLAAAIN